MAVKELCEQSREDDVSLASVSSLISVADNGLLILERWRHALVLLLLPSPRLFCLCCFSWCCWCCLCIANNPGNILLATRDISSAPVVYFVSLSVSFIVCSTIFDFAVGIDDGDRFFVFVLSNIDSSNDGGGWLNCSLLFPWLLLLWNKVSATISDKVWSSTPTLPCKPIPIPPPLSQSSKQRPVLTLLLALVRLLFILVLLVLSMLMFLFLLTMALRLSLTGVPTLLLI